MSPGKGPVLETERLAIRLATEEDTELYLALWTNPQVMVHVGFPRGLTVTRSQILERLRKQGELEFDRMLVVERKDTGLPIGEAKLASPDDQGIAEPDVKLLPESWGNGYGREAWRGLVAYQFAHTRCDAVHGTPNVKNVASIKMQEAAGGVCIGQGVHEFPESMQEYTTPVHYCVYRVSRADWEAGAGKPTG